MKREPTWSSGDGRVELYCGDCLEVLPGLGKVESIIVDPVWPNNSVPEFELINPYRLFSQMIDAAEYDRMAVQLGCDSCPSILMNMDLDFFRVVWLEIARPHYKGRLMYGSDVAYLYGTPPASCAGQHVIPGRMCSSSSTGKEAAHPCPRKLEHVKWLVKWWSEREVVDPFMGSGTTGVAAVQMGRRFIGVEIERKYFDVAVGRIEAALADVDSDMFSPTGEVQIVQEKML